MSQHVTIKVADIDNNDMATIEVKGNQTQGESALPVSSFPNQEVAVGDLFSGQIKNGEIQVDAKY